MKRKSEGNLEVPLTLGVGGWQKRIRGILYDNSFYYSESSAPEDRIYHLHIGEINTDFDQNDGAGFRVVQWMSPEMQEFESIMPPTDPTDYGRLQAWLQHDEFDLA